MRIRRFLAVSLLFSLPVAAATACGGNGGDNGKDDAGDTLRRAQETLENKIGQGSALVLAQAYRGALVAQSEDGARRREVEVMKRAAEQLPGDAEFRGIEDVDGDGRDDDGRVQVVVEDQSACVTVDDNGDVEVQTDACPAPGSPRTS